MEGFFIISGLLIFIIGMYILTYLMNKNTPVPEGIEPAEKCSTCHAGSCSIRDTAKSVECVEDEIHYKI